VPVEVKVKKYQSAKRKAASAREAAKREAVPVTETVWQNAAPNAKVALGSRHSLPAPEYSRVSGFKRWSS
jgi:hypothetical protein